MYCGKSGSGQTHFIPKSSPQALGCLEILLGCPKAALWSTSKTTASSFLHSPQNFQTASICLTHRRGADLQLHRKQKSSTRRDVPPLKEDTEHRGRHRRASLSASSPSPTTLALRHGKALAPSCFPVSIGDLTPWWELRAPSPLPLPLGLRQPAWLQAPEASDVAGQKGNIPLLPMGCSVSPSLPPGTKGRCPGS